MGRQVNDVATNTKAIAWPSWVVNEMSAHIYRSRGGSHALPGAWAKANDNERALYTGYTHAALDWLVKQGWVKLA